MRNLLCILSDRLISWNCCDAAVPGGALICGELWLPGVGWLSILCELSAWLLIKDVSEEHTRLLAEVTVKTCCLAKFASPARERAIMEK